MGYFINIFIPNDFGFLKLFKAGLTKVKIEVR